MTAADLAARPQKFLRVRHRLGRSRNPGGLAAFLPVVATAAVAGLFATNLAAAVPLPATASGNLSLWLDGNTGLTTSGGNVTAWADQSGNNRTVTINGTLTTSATNWGNGQTNTGVVFNQNAANHVSLPSTATLGITLGNYEMFIVARQPTASSSAVQFLIAGTNSQKFEMHLNVTGANPGVRFIPDGAPYADTSGPNSRWGQVYAGRVTGSTGIDLSGTGTGSINGLDSNSVANAAGPNQNNLFLGRRGDGTFPLNGQIAEVLIYNRALTTAERAQVSNHLATKYFASGFGWDADGSGTAPNGGTGTWNTTANRWWDYAATTPTFSAWNNNADQDATFYGGGTVTLGEAITARSLTFHPFTATDAYTLTGNTLTLTDGAINSPGPATIASTLAGTSGLLKTGNGTVTLSGANPLSGPVRVAAGVLALANVAALEAATLDLATADTGSVSFAVAGANTYAVGGLTGTRGLALGGNTLAVGQAANSTYSGILSGTTGGISKSGSGTLTLNRTGGNGAALAGVEVTGGTLRLESPTTSITFNTGYFTGATPITVSAGGRLELGSSSVVASTNVVTVDGGTLHMAVGSANNSGNYFGNLTLRNGAVVSGNAPRVGFTTDAPVITVDGTTASSMTSNLQLVHNQSRTQALTLAVNDVTASPAADFTVSGNIVDDGTFTGLPLTKTGGGTVVFSGTNTFGGPLTVQEGTLSISSINNASANGPLGNSAAAVALGGSGGLTGTLAYTGATAATTKPFQAVAGGTAAFAVTDAATTLTLSGLIDGNGDKSFGGAGSYVIAGGFGGSGTVTKTGAGGLTLTQAGHAGGYDIQAGRLNLNAASAIGNATSLALGNGIELDNSSAGAVTISNGTVAISLGSSLDFLGTQDLNLGVGTVTLGSATAIDVAAGTLTLAGNVVDGGSGFGITKRGTGTLVLSGLAGGAFSGNSVIDAGELYLSGTSVLGGGAGTTLTLNPGGTLRIGGTASTGGVTIVDNGGTKLVQTLQNSGQTFAVSTALAASDALFNGVQTIAVGVTVSASEDWLGSIPASPTAGRIVLEDAAVLASTNAIDINVNKGITLAGASATFDTSAGSIFVRPVISGSGQLVKIGSNGFRLFNTANDYTGGTVAREGTLGIYGDGSLGAVSGSLLLDGGTVNSAQGTSGQTITIDSSRVVQLANGKTSGLAATTGSTLAYAGVLAEAAAGAAAGLRIGSATQGGTVLLGGANTYTGDTTIAGGTLRLGSGGAFASSPRIIVGDASSSGAVLDLTDKDLFAMGSDQTLMGKGTVRLGGGTSLTINGLLSPGNSPGLFTYDGGGTVTLAGTTLMEIQGTSRGVDPGYDAIDVLGGTELALGGILELDFQQNVANGTVFNLFTPDETSSLSGNFTVLDMIGSAYADLTFANSDGIWTTNVGQDNQSMTFDSTTGTLVIVPEPASAPLVAFGLLAGLWWRPRLSGVAKHKSFAAA